MTDKYEIDLIAIDPLTLGRYHIETSVSGSQEFSRLTAKQFDRDLLKERVEIAGQRRTIGFFVERKFGLPQVKAKLAEYGFVDGEYQNVIVTWDWTPDAKVAADAAGIHLWSFQAIMSEIADTNRHQRSYFGDDTLRTINLFVRALAAADQRAERLQRPGAGPAAPGVKTLSGSAPF